MRIRKFVQNGSTTSTVPPCRQPRGSLAMPYADGVAEQQRQQRGDARDHERVDQHRTGRPARAPGRSCRSVELIDHAAEPSALEERVAEDRAAAGPPRRRRCRASPGPRSTSRSPERAAPPAPRATGGRGASAVTGGDLGRDLACTSRSRSPRSTRPSPLSELGRRHAHVAGSLLDERRGRPAPWRPCWAPCRGCSRSPRRASSASRM